MTNGWAKGWVFIGGLALGAVAVAVYLHWFAAPAQPVSAIGNTPEIREPTVAVQPLPASPAAASPTPLPTAAGSCPFEPALTRGSARDGQFALRAALATNTSTDPSGFIVAAKEATAQGRQRDAEVALIMACRVLGQDRGQRTAPLADIKTQLAQHYAASVSREGATARRQELLRRAELLFGESVRTYTLALGKNASKTRLAAQGLETVTQAAAMEAAGSADLGPQLPRAGRPPESATGLQAPTATFEAAAAKDGITGAATGDATGAVIGAATGEATADRPPGECAGAGAPSQRINCSDPELAEMEQDLARLRAQASALTRDPAGFERRQQQAAAQRDTACRDKACLLDWYARRKRQLIDEF